MNFNFLKSEFSENFPRVICLLFFISFIFVLPNVPAQTRDLPDKIRGYKVHDSNITIDNSEDNSESNKDLRVEFDFAEPILAGISPLGITLELGGEMTVFGQSGTVDFITFRDFRVNGVAVNVMEYDQSFDFKKGESFALKKPVEIYISLGQALRGASKEWREAKEKWQVTGRVFVFGRFKKYGFRFKRVIPVEVEIEIDNPVKSLEENSSVFVSNKIFR